MKNNRTSLSREQFDAMKCAFPCNQVIVKIEKKDIKTPSGINLSFNDDVLYGEGEGSHVADMSTVMGTIIKQPEKLYFHPHDSRSMSWETELETAVGDVVFSHPLNVRNADEIEVDGDIYQVWPTEDLFCAKRRMAIQRKNITENDMIVDEAAFHDVVVVDRVIPLNANVILEPIYKPKLSEFDVLPKELDKERAIVRFVGSSNKRYQAKGVADIEGIKVGDMVLIDKNTYIIWLERMEYNSNFDNGKMYYAIQKRFILAVI